MNSIQTRSFRVDGELRAGDLSRILAEAREAGVPSDAKVTIVIAPEGSFIAAMRSLTGDPPGSEVTFTW